VVIRNLRCCLHRLLIQAQRSKQNIQNSIHRYVRCRKDIGETLDLPVSLDNHDMFLHTRKENLGGIGDGSLCLVANALKLAKVFGIPIYNRC